MSFKNWKTTLIGCIGAAFAVAWPLVQTGTVSAKEIAIAALIAVFGYFTKDAGTTGSKV